MSLSPNELTGFTYFVSICTEKHLKEKPNETITFAEISQQCRKKWMELDQNVKIKLIEMAKERSLNSNQTQSKSQSSSNGKGQSNNSIVADSSVSKTKPNSKSCSASHKQTSNAKSNKVLPDFQTKLPIERSKAERQSQSPLPSTSSSVEEVRVEDVIRIASSYKLEPIVKGLKTVRPRNAYSYYFKACQEARRNLSGPIRTMRVSEFSGHVSRLWHQMSQENKQLFTDLAEADKERYGVELQINGPPKKKRKAKKTRKVVKKRSCVRVKVKSESKSNERKTKVSSTNSTKKGALFLKAKEVRRNWESNLGIKKKSK